MTKATELKMSPISQYTYFDINISRFHATQRMIYLIVKWFSYGDAVGGDIPDAVKRASRLREMIGTGLLAGITIPLRASLSFRRPNFLISLERNAR